MFLKIAGLIALVTEPIHQYRIYNTNSDSADFFFPLQFFNAGLREHVWRVTRFSRDVFNIFTLF